MLQATFNKAMLGASAISAAKQKDQNSKQSNIILAQQKALEALNDRLTEIESAQAQNRKIRRMTQRQSRRQRNG